MGDAFLLLCTIGIMMLFTISIGAFVLYAGQRKA